MAALLAVAAQGFTLVAPALRTVRPALLCSMSDGLMKGTVKWFNTEKGFGFISVEGEEKDVFVHQTKIYAEGFRSLADGEEVEFKIETDPNSGKTSAIDVTGPDGTYVQGAPRDPRY